MEITIREATPDDHPTIVRFNDAMAVETEGKSLNPETLGDGVRRILADPERGRYFLAQADDRVVGQLMYTLEWSDWRDGWFWWIQSVYVDKSHRRCGVFSSLYRHLVQLAKRDPDVCGIRLYVDRRNDRAQSTYGALGMSESGYRVMDMELRRQGD